MSLFNKPKRKIQARRKMSDEETEDDNVATIGDIKELQRSRGKKNGLTEIECALGKQKAAHLLDGIQIAGGSMAMTEKQKARLEAADIEAGIREQFEKETLLRDEHEELRKYIDNGLAKLKGEDLNSQDDDSNQGDDVLARAASKLKSYRSETATELLSEHMLAGIPEVDLGINARITNILETEKKKKELIEYQLTGKRPAQDPPTKKPRR
ncbi:unnamed protein product [Auanema sp. JU1783]|nr:unnamed protein product [Auanema sp. JU1783]